MSTVIQKPRRSPTIPIILAGLGLMVAAAYLLLSAPAQPVQLEAGMRPIGFSLGLDDPHLVRLDREGVRAFWRGASCVLPNGFAGGIQAIWPDLERAAPDPTATPIKVIPSGGLYPYYRSSGFADEIASFVRNGGGLLCFGQPLGAAFRALPGSPEGVGWSELSLSPREAVGQAMTAGAHPVLTAISRPTFEAHYAGFLTRVPGTDQTEVLLRDTSTGRPVAAAYRHGRGFVLVTTLVSDAATFGGRLKREEKSFLDQLLLWARAGATRMPQYMPGDTVETTYSFAPGTKAVDEGYVEIYRPDGTIDLSFACPLPPDGGEELSKPLSIAEPRGIWRIMTYRRDADGQAAGPPRSAWFAVGSAPLPVSLTGFYGTICVPGGHLVQGSVAPVTVRLWNEGSLATEITYRGPSGKRTVKLAAGQERSIQEELVMDRAGTRELAYEFYGPAGDRLAVIKRQVTVGRPDRVFASLSAPAKVSRGQTALAQLHLLSVNPGTFGADCWLHLVQNGQILWQEPRRLKLHGSYSTKEAIRVPIPAGARGRLVLEASLVQQGEELAKVWTEMEAE